MDPFDLERRVESQLRRLPQPRAPHTLLPRVLAAVQQAALRPWYEGAWLMWPSAWQVLSVTALVAVVIGIGWLWPTLQIAAGRELSQVVGPIVAPVGTAFERMDGLAIAWRVLWRAAVQPAVGLLLVMVLPMFAACAAFGAVLNRIALGGLSRS